MKYKGRITELPLGMQVLEKNQEETKFVIDENVIKLTEAIVFLTNATEILDLDVSNTYIDDVVANLYKEYKI